MLNPVLFSVKKMTALGDAQRVGSMAKIQPTPEVASLLRSTGNVAAFYRLLTSDGQMLYSKKYKTRNSYTVVFSPM